MRDDMKTAGMSREDQAFHAKEKELVAKRRAELDAKRREREEAELKAKHWMRCPKCGHEMEEQKREVVTVDVCTSCQGIYFDQGELELLMEAATPEGVFAGFKRFLGGS